MKNVSGCSLLGFLAAAFLPVFSAVGGDYEYRFDFAPGDVTLNTAPSGETFVAFKDGEYGDSNPGKPWIPFKDFSVRLPSGETLVSWSVEAGDAVLLAGDVVPAHEQAPVPLDGMSHGDEGTPRDEMAYASVDPYPALRGEYLMTGSMRGIRIASFRVSPLWYVASEKKLYLAKSITVKYSTAQAARPLASAASGTAAVESSAMPASSIFESAVNSLVVNPVVSNGPRLLASVARSGSGCQYLVITTRAMVTAAQKLADFRAGFDNVTTGVVTIEDIEANSSYSGTRPDGKTDVQTKIRNCIKWYVQNKGTEYVVLAGDDTVVPVRQVHVKCGDKEYTDAPSDLYYSDLDGTWDANCDGDYGYMNSGDGTDFYPDVIVGRIPVRNVSQLSHYADKVAAYERGTTDESDIVRKALWMGHTQWQHLKRTESGWVSVEESVADKKNRSITETFGDGLFEVKDRPTGAIATDSEVWTRRMNKRWHRTYRPNVRSAFFNTSATSWDTKSLGDFKKTYGEGGNMQSILNQGWHQLYVSSHGVVINWDLNEAYRTLDAAVLTNRVDFIYTVACLTAAFDDSADPCLSEAFLRAPSGAVAYIGCSREGWGTMMTKEGYDNWIKPEADFNYSDGYAVEFWRRIFDKGDKKLGAAFAAHKSAKISSCSSTGAYRWVQLLLNLQGDPLLTYHLPADKTAEPDTRSDGKPGLVTLLRDVLPETTSSAMTVRLAVDAIPLGSSATVEIEYSKSSSFSSPTTVTVDSAAKKIGEYEKKIAGLSPATEYHVRGKITINGVTHVSPFSLKFTTKAADYVSPTPVPSPATCTFSGPLTVTMNSAASDVTIRYTTDGSEPTAASRAYKGPFVVDFTTVLRAGAFRNGVRIGGIASATYTYVVDGGVAKGDRFVDPIVIRGGSGILTIPSIVPYSVESDEIDHTQGHDTPIRKSIWLEWTAPGSGEVSFTSHCMKDSNNLGSALAVYTGDAMSTLTQVAESRLIDKTGSNPVLSFVAVEGTTYRIAPLNWLLGTDPYSCTVTWYSALTSDGSYVEPDPPSPGDTPDPGPVVDPEPQDAYADYRKTDGTPQSVQLSYYDGPDTRGFAWQTGTGLTSGKLWLLSGIFDSSADASFATNLIMTAVSAKHTECYTHLAQVTGLKPGVYSYRLGDGGKYAYGTFTVDTDPDSFTVLNVNDIQNRDNDKIDCWDRTVAAAASVLGGPSDIDMVVSGGDFIDGNSEPDYVEWGVVVDKARPLCADVPWTMASGNHDTSMYQKCINENFRHRVSGHYGCHSFDVGNVHIVSLPYYDSWNDAVNTWLVNDLSACTSKWRVVSMHFGPYTTVDNGYKASESYVRAVSEACRAGKVDLVLQAHDHGFSKTLPYLWSGNGYATSESDKAATVNVSPALRRIGNEDYYDNPEGTIYISAGCAGHRVGENKGYATSTYKSRGTKIFVDTIKVGSNAGAEASLVPDKQMFGVLRIEGDRLAYDWYLAETNGTATLFDTLRVYKDDSGAEIPEERPVPPELASVTVSSTTTTAAFSGMIASVGNNASSCDVYLAYGTNAQNLPVAEKVLSDRPAGQFNYTVRNLSPGTKYYYTVTISNDAAEVLGAVKSGSFTTFPESGPGTDPGENSVQWGSYVIPFSGPAYGKSNYNGTTDTILVFTNGVGTFTLPAQARVKVLVVGGGGGGGGGFFVPKGPDEKYDHNYFGLGGNGGEVVEQELLLTHQSYSASVGAGGAGGDGNGKAGGNDCGQDGGSSGLWDGTILLVEAAPGAGGKGGETADQKGAGGSGGTPAAGTESTVFAETFGKGGRDTSNTAMVGTSAAPNTGDGGRGARDCYAGGNGGSGIVVVRIIEMSGSSVSSEDWDHPSVPITAGMTVATAWPSLADSALAKADAGRLQLWATQVGKVAFGDAAGIDLEAFLLNCENTKSAIENAKREFRFTAFDPGRLPEPSDFKGYNGVITIEGRRDFESDVWGAKAAGDLIFRAVLTIE